ncbi:hypothetical protein ACQP1W_03370 [Spirillospora sp. CA-255316]
MSFSAYARKVRDPALPLRRRVSALRSCVQLYRPVGFHGTLAHLRAEAGPYERDEAALLRALALIETSRAAWHAAIREYDEARREAKRKGHRKARSPGPFWPAIWYGAPEEAALNALRHWNRRRLQALLTPEDEAAQALARCVDACLASQGALTPPEQEVLRSSEEELERRQRTRPPGPTDAEYFRTRDLLTVAALLKTAARDRSEDDSAKGFRT